jgi:hypothetical protein
VVPIGLSGEIQLQHMVVSRLGGTGLCTISFMGPFGVTGSCTGEALKWRGGDYVGIVYIELGHNINILYIYIYINVIHHPR